MIFDCHTDVLFDVINNNHSFEYHCLEMRNYKGAFLNYYFKGNESHDSFLFVLQKIKEFYKTNFNILKNKNYILGIEGLGPLQDISEINLISEAGIKIITLTWNDMNSLATGTYTNKERGLTNKGITILKELEEQPTDKEALEKVLSSETFIVPDDRIKDYVSNDYPDEVKMILESISSSNDLSMYEKDALTYEINCNLLSKKKVERNIAAPKKEEAYQKNKKQPSQK